MEQVLIQLVIPLIGAFIIGLIVGYMFFKTGRSQRSSANTSDVESLRQELLNKSNEADGFKARAAEFRALLSKRDAMVAERDNYLAELEGRLRATEAEVVSLRMSGTPAGRGGAGRRSFVEDDYDLDDDSPFVEEVPTGQIEVIDLRPGIEDYAADDIVDDIEVPVLARTGGDRHADADLLDGPVSLDGGHSGVAHEVVGPREFLIRCHATRRRRCRAVAPLRHSDRLERQRLQPRRWTKAIRPISRRSDLCVVHREGRCTARSRRRSTPRI